MWSIRRSISVGVVIALAVTACDRVDDTAAPELANVRYNANGGPASATGHVEIHGVLPTPIQDERISFSAISTGNGVAATGQVQLHASRYIGADFLMHAEVTCLSVVGNEAWIGAIVRKLEIKDPAVTPPPFVGTPAVFVVKDNGEGDGVVDEAALIFFPFTAGADIEHCEQRPVLTGLRALRPSTHGNVRVVSN